MNVYDAVVSRRTIRKFKQEPVSDKDMLKLVDCARLAPYGANLQPLKFKIITDKDTADKIYPLTKWAGYLDWEPSEDERPTAYIVVMNDKTIKPTEKSECDSGAAIMSMILEAQELGLSTAWIGALDRKGVKALLNLPENLDVTYLLAAGYAAQSGKTFAMRDSVKYYFDDKGNVNVPKRTLNEVLIK